MVLQQTTRYYAEMDLLKVHGQTYNQVAFRVQVQIIFLQPGDDATSAALVVQTPTAPGAVGGYIFTLNPVGYWSLQEVHSSGELPTMKGGTLTIAKAGKTTMEVEVRNGALNGSINGRQVIFSYPDLLQPSASSVGLTVQHIGSSSSRVCFANFELDQ
jgi:hypothetical protein